MAAAPGKRHPLVRTREMPDGNVIVDLMIPGLTPKNNKYFPKGGEINLNLYNEGLSMDMTAEFKEKNKDKVTWQFQVKQFPSPVDISKSEWKTEKGKIVLTLVKQDANERWMPKVNDRGLDQASSSSSNSEDDEKN